MLRECLAIRMALQDGLMDVAVHMYLVEIGFEIDVRKEFGTMKLIK